MVKVLITVNDSRSILRVDSTADIQYVEVVDKSRYLSDIESLNGPFENDMTITDANFEDLFKYESDKKLIKDIKWLEGSHSLSREDAYLEFLEQIQTDLADYQNENSIGTRDDIQWQQTFIDRVCATITSFEDFQQNR